jgi:cellobiose phosphorylase
VKPEVLGLRVNPRIGTEVGSFRIVRKCRGAEYRINVTNRGTGGAARLVVDGKRIDGTLVPYAPAGTTVTVDCEI